MWPCLTPGWFLVYRLAVAIGTTVLTALNGWLEIRRYHEPWLWFSWATNWGVLGMNLVLWVLVLYVAVYNLDSGASLKDRRMPVCLALTWAVYTAMSSSAFVITGVYWVNLFGLDPSPIFYIPESYVKHSVNSFLVVMDIMVSAVPIRLAHCIFAVGFAVLYCVFNYFWYLFDGPLIKPRTAVYSLMDWREPGIALMFIFMNVSLLAVSQIALLILYKVRLCIQRRWFSERKKRQDYEEIVNGDSDTNIDEEKS